jgi:hypothetical protein
MDTHTNVSCRDQANAHIQILSERIGDFAHI